MPNTNNVAAQPIGIFDSGIGGLTIAKAIIELLPHENIIYFGDTAHFPYGDKSRENIQHYAKRIVDFLLARNCKLILIACNSASAAAYDFLKEYIGDRAVLVNVIDPLVNFVRAHYAGKTVGLIGTAQTINSNIYQHKISELDLDIQVKSLSTPLLASAIERYPLGSPDIQQLLQTYLSHESLQNPDALILGCTHYPMIKQQIEDFYASKVDIIDATKIIAEKVDAILKENHLLNVVEEVARQFYVSEWKSTFHEKTKLFFGRCVDLRLLQL